MIIFIHYSTNAIALEFIFWINKADTRQTIFFYSKHSVANLNLQKDFKSLKIVWIFLVGLLKFFCKQCSISLHNPNTTIFVNYICTSFHNFLNFINSFWDSQKIIDDRNGVLKIFFYFQISTWWQHNFPP